MKATQLDLEALKSRQQLAWSAGNYSIIGTTLQIVGETLCEALDLRAGARVLDVAAGNGNATLAAARRFCDVTSTDYVPALLEAGRRRAEAEGHRVQFQEADVERLPFGDGAFDVVVSTFGAMFAADQARAASEMARVCRPGGKIGLANWTPEGFVGKLFRTMAKYVPPPAGAPSPSSWGTRPRLEELFAGVASSIHTTRRRFNFRYRSAMHFLILFRSYYGPMNRTFEALEEHRRDALTEELMQLLERENVGDGTLVVPSEYLEVVIEKEVT
jgi:ubiquinone/menaquinone biosynthesis C-methylase UbiE